MSVEEESVYFLVFTVARVAGPKTGGGEGGKSEGNPHPPSLFLFESLTPFDAPTPAICPTTPQAKNKTAVNVSLEIISLHSASNLSRCLSLLSETWVTFYDFQVFSWVLSYLPLRGWGRFWYCLLGAFHIPGSFNSRSLYKWRMTTLFVNFFYIFWEQIHLKPKSFDTLTRS